MSADTIEASTSVSSDRCSLTPILPSDCSHLKIQQWLYSTRIGLHEIHDSAGESIQLIALLLIRLNRMANDVMCGGKTPG